MGKKGRRMPDLLDICTVLVLVERRDPFEFVGVLVRVSLPSLAQLSGQVVCGERCVDRDSSTEGVLAM